MTHDNDLKPFSETLNTHTHTHTLDAILNLDCHKAELGRGGFFPAYLLYFRCSVFFFFVLFFAFLFLEGSGQSPTLFYSVRTRIDEDAAKDTADARLQLCMFAISITMVTKDQRQSREIAGEEGCLGPSSAVMFLGEKCLFE